MSTSTAQRIRYILTQSIWTKQKISTETKIEIAETEYFDQPHTNVCHIIYFEFQNFPSLPFLIIYTNASEAKIVTMKWSLFPSLSLSLSNHHFLPITQLHTHKIPKKVRINIKIK